jgi:flagellar biosynthesis/type III secretory pathway protein FliH
MANYPFVPLPKPHNTWEPLVRPAVPTEPRSAGASALASRARSVDTPVPPPPAPSAEAKVVAALKAEWEAKEAARAKEHAAALARLAQAETETQKRAERLTELCAAVEQSRKQLLKQLRTGAGTLILDVSRRIAGDALRTQPELLDRLVADAADALGKPGLTLYVAPADVEHLRKVLKETGIRVDIDTTMSGGLRAESPSGRLDASLETALAALSGVIEQWQQAQD